MPRPPLKRPLSEAQSPPSSHMATRSHSSLWTGVTVSTGVAGGGGGAAVTGAGAVTAVGAAAGAATTVDATEGAAVPVNGSDGSVVGRPRRRLDPASRGASDWSTGRATTSGGMAWMGDDFVGEDDVIPA